MNEVTIRPPGDGFKLPPSISTIKGHQYPKFTDGRFTLNGVPLPARQEHLVPKIVWVGKMFHKDGGPPETCEPDKVDEFNSRIPESDWPIGLSGNREPPFKVWADVPLINLDTGKLLMFSNCTMGMKIAAATLASQVENMCKIRGANVMPVVTIESVLMKTKVGQKARPSFNVVRWVGDEGPALKQIEEPTASEIVNDRLPYDDPLPDNL